MKYLSCWARPVSQVTRQQQVVTAEAVMYLGQGGKVEWVEAIVTSGVTEVTMCSGKIIVLSVCMAQCTITMFSV